MKVLSEQRSFGGRQLVLSHRATSTACEMTFALYLPEGEGPFPVVWYLSGLTCTHANVMDKGEYRRVANELGLAIVCPDTSPRGDVADIEGDWQIGTGAGFYVNATEEPWTEHYQMYSYICDELPEQLANSHYPLDMSHQSIFGHSMGGHGALVMALRNPNRFKSCSAFAPIVNPSTADWSRNALSRYLGPDETNWQQYDAVRLIESGARFNHLLVDQGEADSFLETGLRPWLLQRACEAAEIPLTLRMQPGYDHSYLFISTFMQDHLRWHAEYLMGG